jgi:hypothetical protein
VDTGYLLPLVFRSRQAEITPVKISNGRLRYYSDSSKIPFVKPLKIFTVNSKWMKWRFAGTSGLCQDSFGRSPEPRPFRGTIILYLYVLFSPFCIATCTIYHFKVFRYSLLGILHSLCSSRACHLYTPHIYRGHYYNNRMFRLICRNLSVSMMIF